MSSSIVHGGLVLWLARRTLNPATQVQVWPLPGIFLLGTLRLL